MKKNKLLVYTAIMLAVVFWGFSFIWTKQVLSVYKPITTIVLRLVIASLFLITIGLALRKLQIIKRQHLKNIMLLAFFEPFLYFIGENNALTMVTSTVASVVVSTIPLFSPIAAYWFFKEKFTWMNFVGICISIFGVVLVMMRTDFTFHASVEGVLLLALAVFSAIAYSVVLIKLSVEYNVYSIIAYQNLFGLIYFIPLFLIFDFNNFIQIQPSWTIISYLVQLAVFASTLAFMLFTYSIINLGITRANAFTNLVPVFTALLAFFFFNEDMIWLNIIGIALVISGLFLSQLHDFRTRLRNKRLKNQLPIQQLP